MGEAVSAGRNVDVAAAQSVTEAVSGTGGEGSSSSFHDTIAPRTTSSTSTTAAESSSNSVDHPLLEPVARSAEHSGFPPGLEWMRGRSGLVISQVFSGRLDINALPPPSEEHRLYSQLEDVVQVSVGADGLTGEQHKTYTDVYGREVTEAEHEAYMAKDAEMEKPFRGQLQHLCTDQHVSQS